MIKARFPVYQLNYPSNNVVSPIRTCHEDRYVLPNFYESNHNPYSNSLWHNSEENRQVLNQIKEHNLANKRERDVSEYERSATQSMQWSTAEEPQNKKTYSPLDVETFSQKVKLESITRPDAKTLSYVQTLQKLMESELQYLEMINLCLSTYKEEACHNKKFKNKLLDSASNEELLLFGNLDAMAELSRLFYNNLFDLVASVLPDKKNDSSIWSDLKSDDKLCQQVLHLALSSLVKSHIHRVRSPYHSYCICHKERKRFFNSIKLKNTELFYKWYEICLKKSHFEKLEDLIELPLERLGQWASLIENLCLYGNNILPDTESQNMDSCSKEYISFLSNLNDELNLLEQPQEVFPVHKLEKHHTITSADTKHSNKSSRAVSDISESSSFYSDIPSTNSAPKEQCSTTLKASIQQFNCMNHHLKRWDKALCKLDLAKVLDHTLNTALVWKNLIEFEPINEMFVTEGNGTIYGAYVDKIDRQRQQAMILQLQDLRRKVIKPLQNVLQKCSVVRQKLADRDSLKKEYMGYLRNKETDTHDAKKQILARSFQDLQQQLTESLPVFNSCVADIVGVLLSQYTQLMMHYMKILSGGDQFLTKELELLKSGERELGDNFDILQLFCSSRFYTRNAVRENWTYLGDPRASRAARKLFEL